MYMINIITMLSELELRIGKLYKIYSKKFPRYARFFCVIDINSPDFNNL